MPSALRPFLALAFLGAPLLAQTTWTVDDDGPADFSDLQAAVNAAADGDVLLVREGGYSAVSIVGKGLTLQGQGEVSVSSWVLFTPGPTLRVAALAAGQAVHLRGIELSALGFEQETVVVQDCAGPVLFEDCSIAGAGEPAEILGSLSVTFVRCSLLAPPTFISSSGTFFLAHVPYVGLFANASNVFLYDSEVRGSQGPDSGGLFLFFDPPPGPPGAGVVVANSTLLASGCVLAGGDGGSDAELLCLPGQNGAPGLRVSAGATARLLDTETIGGLGGFGGCGQPDGADAPGIAVLSGTVVELPGPARSFSNASPVTGGASVPIALSGAPGDAVLLHASLQAGPGLYLASYAVALHLTPPLGVLHLGVVPASGTLALDLPTPPLPAGAGAVPFVGQALFVGPTGFFDGGPSTLLILDPTL